MIQGPNKILYNGWNFFSLELSDGVELFLSDHNPVTTFRLQFQYKYMNLFFYPHNLKDVIKIHIHAVAIEIGVKDFGTFRKDCYGFKPFKLTRGAPV